nr:hypothetical protein GCM10017745_45010 [Saccharothrix mutabilis subsp. capreolus]
MPVAGAQPVDPDEIWPQDVRAAIATAPCDANGPSAMDGNLAAQLNPQLATKMAGHLTAYRMSCARVVVDTVRARGLNRHAAAIAISTVIVETGIMNYSEAVDHDSLGLFQQRPSAGWCQPAQCIDPVFATNSFLNGMEREYPNGSWNNASIGDVAADVQRPASQYRYRYGVEAGDAVVIADALWSGMGRRVHPYASGRVVSARSADGRLEAFAAGADGVYHAWQTAVNGGWSEWRFVGGPRVPSWGSRPTGTGGWSCSPCPTALLTTCGSPRRVGPGPGGRTSGVVGTGSRWGPTPTGGWRSSRPMPAGCSTGGRRGGWSAWEGLGGPSLSRLAMEAAPDGRLEVFALSDSTFQHLYQTSPNAGWSAWEDFGGGGRDVAVSHNQDGRLEVFASSHAGVFHKWQTSATSWSGWEGTGGIADAELATGRSVDGRVEVFAINGDTAAHSWQQRPNAPYSGWETFGTGGAEVATANNADGRIEVFGTSRAGVFHKWQTGFSTWSEWAWLNGSAGPGVS